MSNEGIVFIISVSIIALSLIVSVGLYNINDRNLMFKNIETAISKGIDPMAVRCSYAEQHDYVCIAYAASNGSVQTQSKK